MAIDQGLRLRVVARPGVDLDTFAPHVANARWQIDTVPGQPADMIGRHPVLAGAQTSHSALTETFRLLALNVERQAATRQLQSILIMSALPGDGRTMTVDQLSIALAEMGKRVVVVESSAEPTGDDYASASNTGGFLRKLWPGRSTNGAHHSANGDAQRRASFRLTSSTSASTLDALRPVADYVILDSPPCLQSASAFYLASIVDGVLYVVRRRQQDYAAQRNILAQLDRLGANLLGVVYNEG